jgi:hypothetical protein
MKMVFAAVHESAVRTKRPRRHVRSSAAYKGIAEAASRWRERR